MPHPNSTSEITWALEADQAFVRRLDPYLAGHAAENPRFGIGRIKARTGRKGEVVALSDGNRACGRRREEFAGNRDKRRHGDGAGSRRVVVVEESVG